MMLHLGSVHPQNIKENWQRNYNRQLMELMRVIDHCVNPSEAPNDDRLRVTFNTTENEMAIYSALENMTSILIHRG